MKQATIRDVARVAGVSVATISRFLNGSERVLPETKARVEAAMRDLDYTPSASARSLATNRTGVLGLLLDSISGDFFTPLLGEIEDGVSRSGHFLVTSSTRHWDPTSGRLPPLHPRNCDGLMAMAGTLPTDLLQKWTSEGFPMVLMYGPAPEGTSVPSVTVENRQAMGRLVRHLVADHGRSRFAFLRGQDGQYDADERLAGFLQALDDAGVPRTQVSVLKGDFHQGVARREVLRALERGLDFDAVVAADDESAYGALEALESAGLRVPEDVSVTGFDDLRFAALVAPSLTTVASPSAKVGRAAVALVTAQVRGEAVPARTVIPTLLRWRRSCGCYPPKNQP